MFCVCPSVSKIIFKIRMDFDEIYLDGLDMAQEG